MRNKRFLQTIVVTGLCLVGYVDGQPADRKPAVLNIALSKQFFRGNDIIDVEITLRNSSDRPFYVSGNIDVALAQPYGNYDLQTRRVGTDRYETVTKVSSDAMPPAYGRPVSAPEFKSQQNILLLSPQQFIGLRLSGTWSGLTAMPPGKYDVRLIYSARALPIKLDKPFLADKIISDAVPINVLP